MRDNIDLQFFEKSREVSLKLHRDKDVPDAEVMLSVSVRIDADTPLGLNEMILEYNDENISTLLPVRYLVIQ